MFPLLIVEPEPALRQRRKRPAVHHGKRRKKLFDKERRITRYDKQFPLIDRTRKERFEDFCVGIRSLLPEDLGHEELIDTCLQRSFFRKHVEPSSRDEDIEHLNQTLPPIVEGIYWNRAIFELIFLTWSKCPQTFRENWCSMYHYRKKFRGSYRCERKSRVDHFYHAAYMFLLFKSVPSRHPCRFPFFDFLLQERKRYPELPFKEDFIGYNCLEERSHEDDSFELSAYRAIALRGKLGHEPDMRTNVFLECARRKICRIFSCGYWRTMSVELVHDCLKVLEFIRWPLSMVKSPFVIHVKPSAREIFLLAETYLNEKNPIVRLVIHIIYCTSCLKLSEYMSI